MTLRPSLLAAASAVVLVFSGVSAAAEAPVASAVAKPMYGTFGFDTAGMDRTVKPGDDFFAYANGGWVKTTEIPADKSSYSTFNVLADRAAERTRDLIQASVGANAPAGSDARKIADTYASFMDEAAIEARGIAPLKPELAKIAAITDRKALSAYLGATIRADVDVLNMTSLHTARLFGLWVVEDLKDASRYLPYILQGGLGMPDREYYLSAADKMVEIRGQYAQHIARLLSLAGYDDVQTRAARVLALETALAKAHWTATDTFDMDKVTTRWTPAQFAAEAPGVDWAAFFQAAGLGGQAQFGAWQPSAITGLSVEVGAAPLESWRDYLAYHAIARGAPYLPKAFVDEDFAFQGTILSGAPQNRARWKRGVDVTSDALGEAVGKLYAEKYFTPQAKAQMQEMVGNILTAFGARIDRLEWMTPQTKAKAKEKLATFKVNVGYPDRWRDYSALRVTPGQAFENQERAEMFEYRRNLAKLGAPVDRGEWYLTPQTVNAIFAPMQNSITFPAAILEPTFFDPNADAAINYGAIGGVIGHEISHGFDDTGAQFDATGKIANWWTDEDMAHFKASGAALAAQYSAYKPFPDLALNGEQTLGENIADLAGLAAAYDGYLLSLRGKPAPVIDGFTGDQRVFLGWAQNYRSKFREPALRRAVVTGVHSPGPYRAATVRNIDAWYSAFDVKPTDAEALAPDKRVRVW